ncbi:MAG: 5-oxoprolinase subunit PxpA, partial [Bacteroidales bacterium]
ADMGEGIGNDSLLLEFVSSANIACGFHAGNPAVILNTVRQAIDRNVSIGAHPGFPDLEGFGRREMKLAPEEVYALVLYQVGALKSIVESEGGKLRHVKAHGALYNMAASDRLLADSIVAACKAINPGLVIYGLPNSEIENSTLRNGMEFALEAFADRAYNSDGSLVSRSTRGSVITDSKEIEKRVIEMVLNNRIETVDGSLLIIRPDTICVHGDNPHAIDIARTIRSSLTSAGAEIKNPGRLE